MYSNGLFRFFSCRFFSPPVGKMTVPALPPPAWVRGRERGKACSFRPNEKAAVDGGGETQTQKKKKKVMSSLFSLCGTHSGPPYTIVLYCIVPPSPYIFSNASLSFDTNIGGCMRTEHIRNQYCKLHPAFSTEQKKSRTIKGKGIFFAQFLFVTMSLTEVRKSQENTTRFLIAGGRGEM